MVIGEHIVDACQISGDYVAWMESGDTGIFTWGSIKFLFCDRSSGTSTFSWSVESVTTAFGVSTAGVGTRSNPFDCRFATPSESVERKRKRRPKGQNEDMRNKTGVRA